MADNKEEQKTYLLTIEQIEESYAKAADTFPQKLKEAKEKRKKELEEKYKDLMLSKEQMEAYDYLQERYKDSPSDLKTIKFLVEEEGDDPIVLKPYTIK